MFDAVFIVFDPPLGSVAKNRYLDCTFLPKLTNPAFNYKTSFVIFLWRIKVLITSKKFHEVTATITVITGTIYPYP